MVPFSHTGVLLPAVAVGNVVTATVVVDVALQVPELTVTVYVPAAAALAVNDGFCEVLVNPFGPLHEYVAPPPDVKLILAPSQTGVLLPDVAVSAEFTVTETVAVAEQPDAVTVTVYVPVAAVVGLAIVGFWEVLVNEFGPLHEYVVPPLDVKFRGLPAHTGELLPAVADGAAFTVTDTVEVDVQAPDVAVTV